jgi:hypothetical protein
VLWHALVRGCSRLPYRPPQKHTHTRCVCHSNLSLCLSNLSNRVTEIVSVARSLARSLASSFCVCHCRSLARSLALFFLARSLARSLLSLFLPSSNFEQMSRNTYTHACLHVYNQIPVSLHVFFTVHNPHSRARSLTHTTLAHTHTNTQMHTQMQEDFSAWPLEPDETPTTAEVPGETEAEIETQTQPQTNIEGCVCGGG